jgi:hypothetical protein
MSSSDINGTFYLFQFSPASRSSFVLPFANMIEDTHTTAINMERSPSPRLKRGVQFFHPGRSEIIIKNIIEDTHTTAINMERSPSPGFKRGIEEVEDGNLTPPELLKRFKTEHAQENGNIIERSPSHSPKEVLEKLKLPLLATEILVHQNLLSVRRQNMLKKMATSLTTRQ